MPTPRPRRETLVYLALFLLFLGLRLMAWHDGVGLEDHDATRYLREVSGFASLDPGQVMAMSADSTPAFPLFASLLLPVVGDAETAARLTSLAWSCAVFWSLIGIGREVGGQTLGIGLGLALLSLSPFMIRLSFAVLTEPTYAGLVSLGLWLLLARRAAPGPWSGLLLGAVLGTAFLTRVEGLLFLLAVPALQVVYELLSGHGHGLGRLRRLAPWMATFAAGFAIVAAPQIWRTSQVMGGLAINGRQVWTVILNHPDGMSYDEKIYGLNQAPDQINLDYYLEHPEARSRLVHEISPGGYAALMAANLEKLTADSLPRAAGSLTVAAAAVGLLALCASGRRAEGAMLVAFLGAAVAAPLMHTLVLRHVAVLVPLVELLAGIGLAHFACVLAEPAASGRRRLATALAAAALALMLLVPRTDPLYTVLRMPDRFNPEHVPADERDYPDLSAALRADAPPGATPVIAARKAYFASRAGADHVMLPYAGIDALAGYLAANDVGYVYVERRILQDYPFIDRLAGDARFRLLDAGRDAAGHPLELYRFEGRTAQTGRTRAG